MAELLLKLLKFLGVGRSKAADAVDAYDRFTSRLEHRLAGYEIRLDECEQDREEMRSEITDLTIKVARCDEDREQLQTDVARLKDKVRTLEIKTT